MVEITDWDSAKAWLDTQEHQTQVWFAARCALRGLPGICTWTNATESGLAFACLRAGFITMAAASLPETQMTRLESNARAAKAVIRAIEPSDTADTADSAADAAGSVVAEGNPPYGDIAASASCCAAGLPRDIDGHITDKSGVAAAYAAATADANAPNQWRPLWPHKEMPVRLAKGWAELKKEWVAYDPGWSFWIEWYEAILNGTPMPWELTQRIALEVTPEEWDAGPGVVAARIREIRAELSGNSGGEPRQRAFEPASVGIMFTYKEITQASVQSVAVDISSAVERFLSESGANAPPDQFLPLADMPRSLNRIGELLSLARTSGTEQALKEEVGRLNEKIARLEGELQKLRDAPEPVFAPALKAQIARSLGDWKLYAALCAGVWVVSGDDTGVRERCARLLACREINFGDDSPMPKPSEMLPPVTSVEV